MSVNERVNEVSLTPRIESIKGMKFETLIGTAQGDALSPGLFTVYLQIALRKYIEMRKPERSALHQINCYADDADFIGIENITNDLPPVLKEYNLQMNVDKTEEITLSRETNRTLKTRKLGSRLSSIEDI